MEEDGDGDPTVLCKYLSAIARQPEVPKYRTLRLGNPHFHRAAWASAGARALLAGLGFVLAEASITPPFDVTIQRKSAAPHLCFCTCVLRAGTSTRSFAGSSTPVSAPP